MPLRSPRCTSTSPSGDPVRGSRRPPATVRRPALYLGVAAAGALAVNVLTGGGPAADAEPQLASVSIAAQLGLPAEQPAEVVSQEMVVPLEQLAVSRSERAAEQTAAAQAQAAADKAELEARAKEKAEAERKAREEAERKAREAAERKAAEEAAARAAAAAAEAEAKAEAAAAEEAPAPKPAPARAAAPAPAAAPSGSYQQYALGKLGGNGSEFSCLEALWGKESGWNPNAQNPSSSAYGIPQFLDSTWAGTGIGKTSDGYRQIDAGLIYINNRYGSPCGAWSHSQSTGWY